MAEKIGLRPLINHVHDKRRRQHLNIILNRKEPKGKRKALDRYSATKKNPNIDYRIHVYDPIMQHARSLVASYGDNYELMRKDIQKHNYKDRIEMLLRLGWTAATPSVSSVVTTGKGPPVAIILEAPILLRELLNATEWQFSSRDRRIRRAFFMLLDQLADDLAGRSDEARIYGFLSHEGHRQIKWDNAIAKEYKQAKRQRAHLQVKSTVNTNEVVIYRSSAKVPYKIIPKVGIDATARVSHTIRTGDRIWDMHKSYGYTDPKRFTKDVKALNPGIKFKRLRPGQVINVPMKAKQFPKFDPRSPRHTVIKPKSLAPKPGSLRWIGQGLDRPPPIGSQTTVRPKPGSLRWIGQGLDRPPPIRSQTTLRPKPGSLSWMGKGLG